MSSFIKNISDDEKRRLRGDLKRRLQAAYLIQSIPQLKATIFSGFSDMEAVDVMIDMLKVVERQRVKDSDQEFDQTPKLNINTL